MSNFSEINKLKRNIKNSSRYDHKSSGGTLSPRSPNAENFPESLKTPAKPKTSKQVSVGFSSTHASLALSTANERSHTVSRSLSVACVTLEHPSHELLKDNNFICHKYNSYRANCLKDRRKVGIRQFTEMNTLFRKDFDLTCLSTSSDYQSGQLYGLEKFWAFFKYSRKHVLVNDRLREWLSKYQRLEDFRVESPFGLKPSFHHSSQVQLHFYWNMPPMNYMTRIRHDSERSDPSKNRSGGQHHQQHQMRSCTNVRPYNAQELEACNGNCSMGLFTSTKHVYLPRRERRMVTWQQNMYRFFLSGCNGQYLIEKSGSLFKKVMFTFFQSEIIAKLMVYGFVKSGLFAMDGSNNNNNNNNNNDDFNNINNDDRDRDNNNNKKKKKNSNNNNENILLFSF
ncbi:hypothetical protein HELRODRAFT_182607 [Helobdella robusta]|uniref:Uncharacterized protein n=1 Tax=Helobdella robusta TaxID=6412 RepID=T1FIG8_HELRO|nr:hypothetical protein HELRODRAFT_182607 [Helobdella robusta]ESN90780.1 hypothetical protein HELRODRAFT_182607 [Helobdella robusta]